MQAKVITNVHDALHLSEEVYDSSSNGMNLSTFGVTMVLKGLIWVYANTMVGSQQPTQDV